MSRRENKHCRSSLEEEVKEQLRQWAVRYHKAEFIPADPVSFPHRFSLRQDIEISGLLTALMSFGNRKQILKTAGELHLLLGESPYAYVLSRRWEEDFSATDGRSFYRMLSHADFYAYFRKLHEVYSRYATLEEALHAYDGVPMERLCALLGVSARNPQKKLNMFLRWMVRRDSAVDFGLWHSFSPGELLIPLDTHVCRVAHKLGLTESAAFSLANARRITEALGEVFPGDPCLGDYALFGAGIDGVY